MIHSALVRLMSGRTLVANRQRQDCKSLRVPYRIAPSFAIYKLEKGDLRVSRTLVFFTAIETSVKMWDFFFFWCTGQVLAYPSVAGRSKMSFCCCWISIAGDGSDISLPQLQRERFHKEKQAASSWSCCWRFSTNYLRQSSPSDISLRVHNYFKLASVVKKNMARKPWFIVPTAVDKRRDLIG